MPVDLAVAQVAQLAFGYWHAQVLFAATRLGVFDAIADEPADAAEVAQRCGTEPAQTRRLLDACVGLRLLRSPQPGWYTVTPVARRLLTSDSPESLTRWVAVMHRWYQPWGDLTHAVQAGAPVEQRGTRLGDDPGYLRDFILGMHEYNTRGADALPAALPQDGAKLMLDVGGGAGTYSLAFCRAWPGLHSQVIDLPAVTAIAERTIAGDGLSDRITVRAGDYYTDAFGQDADLVLLSNVLHQETPERSLDILRRAGRATRPGGRILVHGHFLDPSRTGPGFTTLHNLSALVLWDGGGSYTVEDMTTLMADAGLTDIHTHDTAEPSAKLLVGRAGQTR